ncbi:MAG: DinB family protein [Acidobacteria bacterium]|nr:DinB family protein [Acidobacteriota bacterium]
MKHTMLSLLLTAAAMCAQGLTSHDRDYALSQLHASRRVFLDAIAGLTPAQWKFKPGPDRWSIAECAEHVALSEGFMFERVRKLLTASASPEAKSEVANDEIMKGWLDRSQKARATGATVPAGRFATPARLAAYFNPRRERTLEYVRTTQDPLRSHFGAANLDAYQWLLAIAGHTERHVLQINEVKADPRYPK